MSDSSDPTATSTGEDEAALVKRLLAGDEAAFERLFDDYFPRLYRFALARLRNEDSALEVAQSTLCKLVDRLPGFRGESPLFTWLCSVCRNEVIDHLRRQQRTAEVDLLEEDPRVRSALEALAEAASASPERELERQRLARFVHAVLDHLPARYGRALELRYLDGLGVPAIAAALGLSYKATESTLSRARLAFRRGMSALETP